MTDFRERYDRAQSDLYGLGTALVTPFKEDLSVDYDNPCPVLSEPSA